MRNLLRIVDFLPFVLPARRDRRHRLAAAASGSATRAAGTLVVRPPKRGRTQAVPRGTTFVQLISYQHTALAGGAVGELSALID